MSFEAVVDGVHQAITIAQLESLAQVTKNKSKENSNKNQHVY